MSNNDCKNYQAIQAELGTYRMLHFDLLKVLPDTELNLLAERFERNAQDLRKLWGKNLSVIQAITIDVYEQIEFRIRYREKFLRNEQPKLNEGYLVCRKCELFIMVPSTEKCVSARCPVCETNETLEFFVI